MREAVDVAVDAETEGEYDWEPSDGLRDPVGRVEVGVMVVAVTDAVPTDAEAVMEDALLLALPV